MKKNKNKPKKARFHGVARSVLSTPSPAAAKAKDKTPYRTVFISDIHLGSRGAQAESLLGFLEKTATETLFVVGDLVDGLRFKKSGHWPKAHTDVFHSIFAKARDGTRVVFTPGNHDGLFHAYIGRTLQGVEIHKDFVHRTADGRRFWITHGDRFDRAADVPEWLFHLGDVFNRTLHLTNRGLNNVRRKLGYPHWCLATYMKNDTKRAQLFKEHFAGKAARETSEKGVDGIICGHIHKAEDRDIENIQYINTGDWVESCTALVEHFDGRLEIIRWQVAG